MEHPSPTVQSTASLTYDPIAKFLHWLVFVLLAIEFIVAWTMPGVHRGEAPTALVSFHFSFGLLILAVIVARVFWRFTHRAPVEGTPLPKWDLFLAHAMHNTLYVALVVMPFAGWMWASYRGWQISFFGLFPVPPLVDVGSSIGKFASSVHSFLGGLLVALIALHAAAACYHHFVLKNDVLKRRLPQKDY